MAKRFFLPEGWFTEPYAARRRRGWVPPEETWQSKPQLAAGISGHSPALLDAVDACVGVTTFVAIPSETRGWLQGPRTEDKTDI